MDRKEQYAEVHWESSFGGFLGLGGLHLTFWTITTFGDWKSKGRIDYPPSLKLRRAGEDDDEDEKKTLRCDRMLKTRDATKK